MPGSWHPSGKLLAFEEQNPKTSSDVMILPMDGDEASGWKPGTPTVLLNSAAMERDPMFSPDGRWLAYVSDASGRSEVFVRPFPGPVRRCRSQPAGAAPRRGRGRATRSSTAPTHRSWLCHMRGSEIRSAPENRASGPRQAIRRADQIACSICIQTASGSCSRPRRSRPTTTSSSSSTSSSNCAASLPRRARIDPD